MSVRNSLARLERTAARAFGADGSPCRCQGPTTIYSLVVVQENDKQASIGVRRHANVWR